MRYKLTAIFHLDDTLDASARYAAADAIIEEVGEALKKWAEDGVTLLGRDDDPAYVITHAGREYLSRLRVNEPHKCSCQGGCSCEPDKELD